MVEMMVVMGIMAIMTMVGAFALLSAKDAGMVDSAAENLLNSIQEAQNKAIAIDSEADAIPKIWALNINKSTKSTKLVSYKEKPCTPTSSLATSTAKDIQNDELTRMNSVTYEAYNGSNWSTLSSGNDLFIDFSTPFGWAYATTNTTDNLATGCHWKSNTPINDYSLIDSANNVFSTRSAIRIKLTYKNVTKYVVVQKNGDAYIQ